MNKEYFDRACRVTPGGVHSPVRAFRGVGGVPRFIASAKGVILEDIEGMSYTDYCLAFGPMIFGHQDPDVLEAVQAALHRGWSYGTAEPYSLLLAECIVKHVPHIEKIRFVNSGTEAVMAALRVARAATGRSLIVKCDGGYHGHADSMLVRSGSGLAEMTEPDSAGVSRLVAQETLVVPLSDFDAIPRVFDERGASIAAIILEGVPANYGLLPYAPGYLRHVQECAHRAGSLLILDEVITGFRCGFGGVAAQEHLDPDLITYGKIIGGGFPVGAYGGKSCFMDLVAPLGAVYQAGTLSANPVAMTAGFVTLTKLLTDPPYERFEVLGKMLDQVPGMQRMGSIFWPVIGSTQTVRKPSDTPTQHREFYPKLFHKALAAHVYLAPSAFEVGFLATPHTEADIAKLLGLLKD